MLAQPSMIKRPVLDLGGTSCSVGFKPETYRQAIFKRWKWTGRPSQPTTLPQILPDWHVLPAPDMRYIGRCEEILQSWNYS